ncbi:hypothetical protein EVAR_98605_1 [Eumeta japonica]|uniref:Uncharacterized protein n=1 Tax=Eumeta variegata TaxID=151549 RepID=A0A4C1XWV7_EUMVA|nr:hypothetical protein EVAR_98605_1 [Eumeta japonica]
MNTHTFRPTTAGGSGKGPMVTLTMDQIKALFTQFLAEKGIVLPENSLNDVATTAMSRSGSPSPSIISGKRPASARSSEASTDQSDGTVRGSDSEEDDRFTTVVNKKRSRRLRKRRSATNNSPSMDIDTQLAAPTTFIDSPASPVSPDAPVARPSKPLQPSKISGAKPTAPPKIKPRHPFTYAIRVNGMQSLLNAADCTSIIPVHATRCAVLKSQSIPYQTSGALTVS